MELSSDVLTLALWALNHYPGLRWGAGSRLGGPNTSAWPQVAGCLRPGAPECPEQAGAHSV